MQLATVTSSSFLDYTDTVYGTRVDATKEQIEFASDDEERLHLMQYKPAHEIGKATIHDIKTARIVYQDDEHIALVHLAFADVNESWNVAA
jgi:hypothetical protein